MKISSFAIALLLSLSVVAPADAQTNVRIRGTITAIDGNVMSVKSRDGRDLKIQLADNLTVAVAKAARFEDIKAGDYVGATTKPGPDGMPVALEVHYLAPTVQEGQNPSDLESGATMTNASVDAVVAATGKRELSLRVKGGLQTIAVPGGASIVRSVPGVRADLAPGEYVFVAAQAAADGALTAARIQVSKDGVRPGQ